VAHSDDQPGVSPVMSHSGRPHGPGFGIVDAHHHLWDLGRNPHPWLRDHPMIPFRYGDYSALRRDYLPADYRRDTRGFEVAATVYVEAEWDPKFPLDETRWVHAIAAIHSLPDAMVAQAWLDREDVADVLAAQAAFPLVRSVRHKPRAAASPGQAVRGRPGSMDCPRWRDGFTLLGRHGLCFDLQTPWWHFDAAAELAGDFPDTTIVVNHTGLPADRSLEGLAGWRAAMALLARQPNVRVKISGLGLRDQAWTVEANGPVVRDAIAIFGVERAMFASNFPVDSLVASFDRIFDGFARITGDLDEAVRRRLFRDNAAETYRIDLSRKEA
jgi:predicted TIM-barrel fold metal-dependent hydrolase